MTAKIMIYSPSAGIWGGGQIYTEQLCNYANQQGIESYLFTAEPETYACATRKIPNVVSKKTRFLSVFGIARNAKKEGFDTVILSDLSSLWLASIFRLYGYRVYAMLMNNLQKKSTQFPLGHPWLEYWLLRGSAYFCQALFSVDKHNLSIFHHNRVEFVGNFVPEWFHQTPPKNTLEPRYDFLLLARFAEQKNIPLFLKMLHGLHQRGKPYTALLVGDGPEREAILALIGRYGLSDAVCVEGWVERQALPHVYDRARCFVISSYHDGFATTLAESHARGLPAIVTRSSGFSGEFVTGYGEQTGIVFEPSDINREAFYDEVSVLVDSAQTYGARCKQKAKRFSQENVLGKITTILQSDAAK
jgi:glycosyltransferase involved in cell wall biosynthesis